MVVELEGREHGVAERRQRLTPWPRRWRSRGWPASRRWAGPATASASSMTLGGPRGSADQPPRRDREAVVAQHRLGDALVHADGGGQDAGADVGHAERFEVALQDAVLAEGPVERREHHGVRWAGRRRDGGAPGPGPCATGRPATTSAATSATSARTRSASTHRLSWVSPTTRTVKPPSSAVATMRRAEMHDTSCSADGPP